MNIKVTKSLLMLSVSLHLIIASLILTTSCSGSQPYKNRDQKDDLATLQDKVVLFMRNTVSENLYYPNTYDPVRTTIDSVFYGPLTDGECIQAAQEIIDLRSQYSSAKNAYNEAVDLIKFHGITDLGTFHFGKDRDKAKSDMNRLLEEIKQRQFIIRNRDTSMDGKFIGWQVAHRFRASNNVGAVSFGTVLYIINPEVTECYFRYSLDENDTNNFQSIREVIESELGLKYEH